MPDTVDSILRRKGHQIWSVTPGESVFQAVSLMADKGIGALLVIDDGKLLGIISERDYARKVILQGKFSKDTLVSDIMTTPVVSVGPDHTVDDCMHIVSARRIRHLPVVQDEQVIGIVSIGDLVRSVISAQSETINYLHKYIGGRA